MENIFIDAKIGDVFLTRNGEKAYYKDFDSTRINKNLCVLEDGINISKIKNLQK